MKKRKLLCAGHSHMNCLVNSLTPRMRHEPGFGESFECRVMQLRKEPFDPNFSDKGGKRSLTTNFIAAVTEATQGFEPDALLTMINGQEFQVLSLVRHPNPYDFAYPGDEEPLDPNARIIPYSVMRAEMLHMVQTRVTIIQTLFRSILDCPIYQIVPPPPIEDADHIFSYPGPFAEKAKNYGVSPASFRRKMWLLYRDVLREESDKAGVITLDPPDGSVINGYFARKYWPKDPIHGNIEYGRAVFDMVADIVDGEDRREAMTS